jgi:predicted MFS family arabinose efflux permease
MSPLMAPRSTPRSDSSSAETLAERLAPAAASRPPVAIATAGMIAMAVGIGIGRFVYTPILPPMLAALGLSKASAGLIASANFLGYLVGALGAARAALPGQRRLWLAGALLLSAATTTGMGYCASVPGFMALRFLGGLASALALILSSALVLDNLARMRRPGLAALHFSGVGIGITASAALVAVLLDSGIGWQEMWRASGAMTLLGAIAVAILAPGDGERLAASASTGPRPRDVRLWRMAIAYGLFGFGYVITATFLVAIVRDTPAIRELEPVIWIVVGLAAAPSVLFWSYLGRRLGTQVAFAIAALAEAAGVLASVVLQNTAEICAAAILVGGTFMGLTALGLMRGRELAVGDPRFVMAAMTGAFGVGQIAGPLVAGVVSDVTGGFGVPSIAAAVALVGAAWLARK